MWISSRVDTEKQKEFLVSSAGERSRTQMCRIPGMASSERVLELQEIPSRRKRN